VSRKSYPPQYPENLLEGFGIESFFNLNAEMPVNDNAKLRAGAQ
jgi:hypothetical protein